MANTKYVLEKIKVEGAFHELLVKTNAENTAVTWKDQETTLASALADIFMSITNLPTADGVDTKISAAIDELIGGAPETYNTLKEIADFIAEHQDVADSINAAIGDKVDKVEGKGLSAEDFTAAFKDKLEAMPAITAEQVAAWDNLRGVRVGAVPPADMKDGELFIREIPDNE